MLSTFKNVKSTFSNFGRGGLLCWLVSGIWYLVFWYLVFGIWYLVFWYLVFKLCQALPSSAKLCQAWVKICRRALPTHRPRKPSLDIQTLTRQHESKMVLVFSSSRNYIIYLGKPDKLKSRWLLVTSKIEHLLDYFEYFVCF